MNRNRVLALTAVLATAPAAFAQISATLQGRLTDPTGAAIPNASITLIESATNIQRRVVAINGNYTFSDLTPGVYELDIAAAGFSPLHRKGITATIGQTTTLPLALTINDQTTIEVTADAPLLQAAQADIETHIPGAQVVALPLNSRNFIALTQLSPGVELPPGTVLPRINGGRPRTNEYLYDGISALQPEPGQVAFFPVVDGIQEFTIEADNVPAEFGRFNGGVVNVATRSGSNTFHGSVFEFFRNEDLNTRNYFAVAGARKPLYRRNLYGGTLGGPLLHDRLFFFSDYQGIKLKIGKPLISTVPTLAERGGNFSGVSKIYNPAAGVVTGGRTIRPEFANDTITTPLDTAAVTLLARIPVPTQTGAANNFTYTGNDQDHQNQFDFRLDGAFRAHDRAFGRYSYFSDVEQPITPFPDGSGAIPSPQPVGTGGVAGLSHVLGQQAVFNEVHTFTAALLNDLHVGYTRRGNTVAGPALGTTASAALGIPGIPTNAAFNNALPLFTFSGFQQLGPSASTFAQYQTAVWQLEDSLNYVVGRHQVKLGADVRWYQLNAIAPPNPTGSFAFTTTGTNTQSAASATASGGNAFASFLLGQVDTFNIDLQTTKLRPRDHIQEYFVQDNWRVSDSLTFDLGARWSLHSPSTEKNNQGAVFNTATQLLDYAGQTLGSNSARSLHYGNVAPRIGLTYDIEGLNRAVIRAGYGIVFIDQSGITTPFTLPQFPFIQNVRQATQDSITSAFQLAAGPTVAPIAINQNAGLGQSVYTADRNAGSGYSQQWNLAFQRQVTRNLSFDLAYVGSHIVHVGVPDSNLNQITAAQLFAQSANGVALNSKVTNPYYGQLPAGSTLSTPTIAEAQVIKAFPRFQNVATYRHNSGQSNYNAFEAKVEQRPTRGLYLLLAYTHSKLIDDASSVFSTTVLSSPNSSSLIAADTFNPLRERDSSGGDMPNVTTVAATYDFPKVGVEKSFLSPLLNGWSLNTIVTLQSGMPVTITQATNNNAFAGFSIQRPNIVGNPKDYSSTSAHEPTPQQFFNTAAFSAANTFQIGTASRNPVRGPAYRDLDVAMVKHTRIFENTDVEFRAEVFDLTNTPAFAQPNGSFGSAAFGSITSTSTDPRVVQFALRLSR